MSTCKDLVERKPGVRGGYPVIRGTQTPVRSIIMLYRTVYPLDRHALYRALPHLSPEEIEAAIEYYRDQPTLIDADIARQRDAMERLLPAP